MAGAVYRIEERKSLGFIYTDAKRERCMHLLESSSGLELFCAEMGYFQEIGFCKVGRGPWVYKL